LIDQRKKKWEKTVEAVNFTHSSRKAWKMLKKPGTDAILASRQNSITANDLASRLLRVSKTQRDREHVCTTKMNLRRKKRTLTVNQTLSRCFTLDEHDTALMSLKPGKTAGFDGIYLFIYLRNVNRLVSN
jgi:hypothetical protein